MIAMLAALAVAAAPMAQIEALQGRWQTETRHGVVEITQCADSICGAIVASDGLRENPDLRDVNNRDQSLRQRPVQNLQILEGFTWRNGAWVGGHIYNAHDGGTYSATITPVDADHLTLRGCIVWPLCKTEHWTRVR